jgi:hypothetical protein
MKTTGHVTLMMTAQVINGHRHGCGSDHCHARRPETHRPSSGIRKTYSIEKFSLATQAIMIAGSTYISDNTMGNAAKRTRSPVTARMMARAEATQTTDGGK